MKDIFREITAEMERAAAQALMDEARQIIVTNEFTAPVETGALIKSAKAFQGNRSPATLTHVNNLEAREDFAAFAPDPVETLPTPSATEQGGKTGLFRVGVKLRVPYAEAANEESGRAGYIEDVMTAALNGSADRIADTIGRALK
jgi:hypothetical protein